ncbi:hypothetical protein K438DRAFT_1992103 [Mycena galopus ATCC 62051]|nr:hypothetical protein K438DRAFT_1992103 [Mycena galopus ATCC 62051]
MSSASPPTSTKVAALPTEPSKSILLARQRVTQSCMAGRPNQSCFHLDENIEKVMNKPLSTVATVIVPRDRPTDCAAGPDAISDALDDRKLANKDDLLPWSTLSTRKDGSDRCTFYLIPAFSEPTWYIGTYVGLSDRITHVEFMSALFEKLIADRAVIQICIIKNRGLFTESRKNLALPSYLSQYYAAPTPGPPAIPCFVAIFPTSPYLFILAFALLIHPCFCFLRAHLPLSRYARFPFMIRCEGTTAVPDKLIALVPVTTAKPANLVPRRSGDSVSARCVYLSLLLFPQHLRIIPCFPSLPLLSCTCVDITTARQSATTMPYAQS